MDSNLPSASIIPNPQHDIGTTKTQLTFPYDQVILDLDVSIAETELEKVFNDLYLGIRAETTIGWAVADSSKVADATKTEALSDEKFKGRGSVLISAIATSELAKAYEALAGAFWLASISGGDSSQAFRFGGQTSEAVSGLIARYSRYLSCVSSVGWACFTLLTLSPAFRYAVKHLPPDEWENFSRLIGENKGSFELISRTVRPKYGILLAKMLQEPAYINRDTSSDPSLYRLSEASNGWINHYASLLNLHRNPGDVFDITAARYQLHPHRWCLSLDKSDAHMLTSPYLPIVHSILGHDFRPETDPRVYDGPRLNVINRLKDVEEGRCDMCISIDIKTCDATCQNEQPLVELFEAEGKGVGVRSLQSIEGGMTLAEYAGYITKDIVFADPYVLRSHHTESDSKYYCTTSIFLGLYSSEPFLLQRGPSSLYAMQLIRDLIAFTCLLFPDKEVPSVISLRKIRLFEEITVSYGQGYFIQRGITCLCGAPEWYSQIPNSFYTIARLSHKFSLGRP
ncbi:hypothetical protein DFP73DRAFT_624138 [Morchella snyderi]|nr:hypothetical protein DFP73DRAFT_624138 [Morchella snyderi]